MTATWTLPLTVRPGRARRCPTCDLRKTRVVVPTFRDWDLAYETVDGLLRCRPRPCELVLVNDNDEPGLPRWARDPRLAVVDYPGNLGPSVARNVGARAGDTRRIDWIYFTDTGCSRAPDFFARLVDGARASGAPVAVAGPVIGRVRTPDEAPINHYMTTEGVLHPPFDAFGPQAIVTANALVEARAFNAVGGFDASYPFAAAEDLDLGIRLRGLGSIGWAEHAVVRHRFEECIEDFVARFVRYGRGVAHLERTFALPSLRPIVPDPGTTVYEELKRLQMASMCRGYDAQALRCTSR